MHILRIFWKKAMLFFEKTRYLSICKRIFVAGGPISTSWAGFPGSFARNSPAPRMKNVIPKYRWDQDW
jgi:hypothetical protein